MKKLLWLIPFAGFLFACQKDFQTGNNQEEKKFGSMNGTVKLPMKISFYSITDWNAGPITCTPIPTSGPAAQLAKKGWIGGYGTHIGEVQWMNSTFETLDCQLDQQGIVTQHAVGKITADNGDCYYYDWVAKANMMMGTLEAEVTIDDGTGKFMGATGWVKVKGTMDPTTREASWTGEGWIMLVK